MIDCSPALPKLVHKKGSGVAPGNEFRRKTLAAPALGAANVFEVEIKIENYRTIRIICPLFLQLHLSDK
jgi:hypothetical protein